MLGLMQDWPLTVDKILGHAAQWHPRREIVSRSVEGPIVRTNYGDIHQRAKRLSSALLALGINLLAAQVLSLVLGWYAFRKIFPALRFGMKYVSRSVLRQTASYGAHTFVAMVAGHSLSQGVSLLIAFFLPASFVGYYALPSRLLQYTVDLVERVGFVSASTASELAAHGDKQSIARLGMYSNRYSFAMFMPLTIFLLAYGREFLNVWVGPNFAVFSPVFV